MQKKVTLMWRTISVAIVTGLGAIASGALAAEVAAIDPAARMQDEIRRAERAAPSVPSIPRPAPAEPLEVQVPILAGTVLLKEVVFSPSQLLDEAELRRAASPYLGREVNSRDLNAFLREIQALYLGKGIETAVPVLPQQDLRSGHLRVLLVEGKLGAIRINGASGADPAWIGRWFDLALGSVIRPGELERRLNIFNAVSDYGAQGRYGPGAEFGLSNLSIDVPDAPVSQRWSVVDVPEFGSSHLTGSSLTTGYRLYPLGSRGGRIDATAIVNPSGATLSMAAGLPLGQQGWRLGASATASRSRTTVKSSVADAPDLRIHGESSSMGMELSRYQAITDRQLLQLSANVARVRSKSTVSGEVLSDRTVDRLTLAAATDWPSGKAGDAALASLRASLTVARGPVNSYSFAEVWGSTSVALGDAGWPVLRINGQARLGARNNPDATDVWLAGGGNSVRGFNIGAVTGNRGQALQLTLAQSMAAVGLEAAEAYLFSDQARAVKGETTSQLASMGGGVRWQVAQQVAVDAFFTRQTAGLQGAPTRLAIRASTTW